jgi:hypothetical protein
MDGNSRRRQRRKESRERTRNWQLERYWAAVPFPPLVVDDAGGDLEMVQVVRELARAFDLRKESCRLGVNEMYFKMIMEYGIMGAQDVFRALLRSESISGPELDNIVSHQVMGTLEAPGRWLFERLPERFKAGALMRYFFYVAFDEHAFVVRFRFMDTAQSPGGTVYLPPGRPRVDLAGHSWQLAFHGHALERLCERVRATPQTTYFQYSLLWTMLTKNLWVFDAITLNNGQQGVRVLLRMDPSKEVSRWYDVYVQQLLGWATRRSTSPKLAVVLGYLPVEVNGRYARAVTFLFPGFRNTPEHKLIDQLPPSAPMRRRIEAISRHANFHSLFYRKTVEAIKWFHDNGVPQVFPWENMVEGKARATGGDIERDKQ